MIKNHIKNWKKIITLLLMWLNWSVVTINATLQLLDILALCPCDARLNQESCVNY